MHGIALLRLLGRQTVGIMRRREGRQDRALGSLVLADGTSRIQKQAKRDKNQNKMATSRQVRALLLPIGIFRCQIQSFYCKHPPNPATTGECHKQVVPSAAYTLAG